MAAPITPTELQERARGAFDDVDEAIIADTIEEAMRYVSASNWASRYTDGVFYMTCHILTEMALIEAAASLGGPGATSGAVPPGPLQSESILSWKGSYAVSEGGVFDDALATTTWGRMFISRRVVVFSDRCI